MPKKSKYFYSTMTLLSLAVLTACSSNASQTDGSSTSDTAQSVTTANATTAENAAATIDWESLPTTEVSLTNEGLTITEEGTYILTGSTTGGVTVKADGNVRIILAGATISSTNTAALYVDSAENAVIELQEGTDNTIKDASTHSDSEIEGALHSKADLTVTGTGNLTVEGNYQDAIVSTDNLTIVSGKITVNAADDGIRGKDSLVIHGGTLDVTAAGDGLKSNNDEDTSKGYTHIIGGTITVNAGDDAIKAESSLTIDGGTITVATSAEALEGTNITINGGNLDLYATDDGINAASDVTGADIFIKVTGGDIKVEVAQGDTDAIDSNGDLYVSGGNFNITAQSAFDVDGTIDYTGGTVVVNGEEQSQISSNGPGGGAGGAAGRIN